MGANPCPQTEAGPTPPMGRGRSWRYQDVVMAFSGSGTGVCVESVPFSRWGNNPKFQFRLRVEILVAAGNR
ncbi:hypothetical protein RUM44_009777 [Polyplax serrata]|uniref:Uncharacterized protein n=1 Tax=Polyplax serrata TaxID=468196 RepID=A0ABR1ATM9_POLSC